MGEFYRKLDVMADEGRMLCVGLDPRPGKLPAGLQGNPDRFEAYSEFLFSIVDAVGGVAGAIKPNKAFYEALNGELEGRGNELFDQVVSYTRGYDHRLVLIGDSKRADIGSTNGSYAVAEFDVSKTDAVTTNPYFGAQSAEPFTDRTDKGVIVLARTSNDGTQLVQDIPVRISDLAKMEYDSGEPVYETEQLHILSRAFKNGNVVPFYAVVASQVRHQWNKNGNCGVVAGATYPEELRHVREIVGDDIPILIPGVGAQGGDANTSAFQGANSKGRGILVNESRSIIYASMGNDFAEEARRHAEQSTEAILSGANHRASLS